MDENVSFVRVEGKLQCALSKLLQDDAFMDVSINDICAEASINRTTFFAHYYDKNTLLDGMLSDLTVDNYQSQIIDTEGYPILSNILLDPLPKIIKRQKNDIDFKYTYRQYLLDYCVEALGHLGWHSMISKELVAYNMVDNVLSINKR